MTKNKDTIICPHCGEEIPNNIGFCPECGKPLK